MKVWPFFGFLFLATFIVLIMAMSMMCITDDVLDVFVISMLCEALLMGFFYFKEEML